MRLVDADELMIKFEAAQKEAARHGREFASCFYDHGGEVSTNWYCVEDMVDNAPTVDAVPVVHGHWIDLKPQGDSRFMCTVCKWKEKVPTCMGEPTIWMFCPSCGARMDGKDGEQA